MKQTPSSSGSRKNSRPTYEAFGDSICLERSLIGGDIIGFKVTHYTDQGLKALETLAAAMLDALFAPADSPPMPADALTRALIEHLDLRRLLSLAA